MSSTEILDVVDAQDVVVSTAPRGDVYARKLPHRIVHVHLFDTTGRMALQLRSASVKFCPNHWSTAVGGHVRAGETYEQAAARECREELGVQLELTPVAKLPYTGLGLSKFLQVFRATFDGPFAPDPAEVATVDFFTRTQVADMLARGDQFHPELLFLLGKQYGVTSPGHNAQAGVYSTGHETSPNVAR